MGPSLLIEIVYLVGYKQMEIYLKNKKYIPTNLIFWVTVYRLLLE